MLSILKWTNNPGAAGRSTNTPIQSLKTSLSSELQVWTSGIVRIWLFELVLNNVGHKVQVKGHIFLAEPKVPDTAVESLEGLHMFCSLLYHSSGLKSESV